MDFYETKDVRFKQERQTTSAAGALVVAVGPVPAGKVWTILEAKGTNNVGAGGETQYVWFAINSRGSGNNYPVTRPVQQLIDNTVSQFFPLLTEGMELQLHEGDSLAFFRAAATAGSTINLNIRFIESDVPLYTYEEPQIKLRAGKLLSSLRSDISRSRTIVGGGSRGPITRGERSPREK